MSRDEMEQIPGTPPAPRSLFIDVRVVLIQEPGR